MIGKDFAGTVEAIGEDVGEDVGIHAAGDAVFGVVMKPFLGEGSLAQYVTVSAGYGVGGAGEYRGLAEPLAPLRARLSNASIAACSAPCPRNVPRPYLFAYAYRITDTDADSAAHGSP